MGGLCLWCVFVWTGSNRKKAEEKYFRDLMKYEGLDEDFCDLIRDTERISKMVQDSKKRSSTSGSGGDGGKSTKKVSSGKTEHDSV